MNKQDKIASKALDEAIEWVAKLNDDEFDSGQEETFTAWLSASELNQAAYLKAEDLWDRGDVILSLYNNRYKKCTNTRQLPSWLSFTLKPARIMLCSCILVITVAILSYTNQIFNSKYSSYTFETAIGEQKEVGLVDGSHITLNTNSSVFVKLGKDSRTVNLTQGEVFFDVKTNSKKPFYVKTQHGLISVIGTKFSVHQTEFDTVVTVVEGKVGLSHLNGDAKTVVLTKNERTNFKAMTQGFKPEGIIAGEALAWRKQHLVFKGAHIQEVIRSLNRYFPQTIQLSKNLQNTPELKRMTITAVFKLSDFEGTLTILKQSLKLDSQLTSNGNIILLESVH